MSDRIHTIHWRPIVIVEGPESGKTNTAFYLAEKLMKKYGNNVNTIYVKKLRNSVSLFNSKTYQVIIVDEFS